jgi:hypothetical protein
VNTAWTRRRFMITTSGLLSVPLVVDPRTAAADGLPLTLEPQAFVGTCTRVQGPNLVPGAVWYVAQTEKDGLAYRFRQGALAGARFITADMLADEADLAVFELLLQEGSGGPVFSLYYALLPYAEARMRMRTEAVDQNRWQFPREGAWLKPMAAGARVDLGRVDRMTIRVLRKSARPVRWCMTGITATSEEPPRIASPRLPKGPLLDAFGQSTTRVWPGRTRSHRELAGRLRRQLEAAAAHRWPAAFSKWGGLEARTVGTARRPPGAGQPPPSPEGGRFFRTHHDGTRWWLLDPDGHPFWSTGLDSVRVDTAASYDGLEGALGWKPPTDGPYRGVWDQRDDGRGSVNYLAANFVRVFGSGWYDRWSTIALGELKRLGFNTVANWSDWKIARAAGIPYVRPLEWTLRDAPFVFRDFPDVFDPRFDSDAGRFADQLAETRDDRAFIGYFLMNEPTWGFAKESPAAGMLFNTPRCATRTRMREFLAAKYETDAALARAWRLQTTLAAVGEGEWTTTLTPQAEADMAEFSAHMVEKFFGALSASCRRVDPNHLNLGIRYHTTPPPWAIAGMRAFDVFSMNCYEARVKAEEMTRIADMLRMPVMVGEYHFGALDVGLPASGIGHVKTQADRGRAYRVYVEDAAARPWCVGVHYFIMYDQSALGRFDGECYNIGFFDVCNQPYQELCAAARLSHERLYDVALGKQAPFDEAPEYLPKLFL